MSDISRENNGSGDRDSFSEEPGNSEISMVIINCVLNVSLMLVSIFGNALVILAMTKTPSIRSSSMIMMCSLALSDFLVGLVVQPLYIGQQLSGKSILLLLEASIGYSVCGASFLTITAISLDRFSLFIIIYDTLLWLPNRITTSYVSLQSFGCLVSQAWDFIFGISVYIAYLWDLWS